MRTLFIMIIVLCGILLVTSFSSFAAQFDAPHYKLEKKHGAEWAKEDKAIDAKLAALEKKYKSLERAYLELTEAPID